MVYNRHILRGFAEQEAVVNTRSTDVREILPLLLVYGPAAVLCFQSPRFFGSVRSYLCKQSSERLYEQIHVAHLRMPGRSVDNSSHDAGNEWHGK